MMFVTEHFYKPFFVSKILLITFILIFRLITEEEAIIKHFTGNPLIMVIGVRATSHAITTIEIGNI